MQQRPLATRKRAAPGAAPSTQQQQQPQQPQFNGNSNLSFQPLQDSFTSFDNQSLDWNGSGNVAPQFNEPSGFDSSVYDPILNGGISLDSGAGPVSSAQSGQLVRRNPNQQLVSRGQPSWQDTGGSAQPGEPVWPPVDDEADLEQRALEAKKEAQAKRKQIPPFVQKLSR
jgi:heat shock transcription factor